MPIDFENLTSSKGSYTTTFLSPRLGIVAVTPWSNPLASIVDTMTTSMTPPNSKPRVATPQTLALRDAAWWALPLPSRVATRPNYDTTVTTVGAHPTTAANTDGHYLQLQQSYLTPTRSYPNITLALAKSLLPHGERRPRHSPVTAASARRGVARRAK